MGLFTMDRHQHLPAATMVLVLDSTPLRQQSSTNGTTSKLATSSSSNAAVGETVARTTVEPTSPHRRHERRTQNPGKVAVAGCR